MAGRDLPGHHHADDRWLVDRQVYERRRDGVRYVSWSRSRQLRLAWLAAILLLLAGGLGAFSFWAWQRLGPDLIAVLPVDIQARIVGWIDLGHAAPADAQQRQLRNALDEALRERDSARAKLAELGARVEAAAMPDQVEGAPGGQPARAAARTAPAADPDLEMTLLRHERDAAREQIDALMQLTTQLKAELGERSAGREAVVQPVMSMGAAAKLESDLESAREATRKALTERDALQAKLLEASAAAQALQASHDSLAGRIAETERALADRDRLLSEGRGELATAREALAEARDAAQAAGLANQAMVQELRSDLDARTETARALQSEVAALEARLAGLEGQLERTRAERDEAMQAERAGREQRDAMAARLQALDGERSAGDSRLVSAERDQLAARLGESQAALADAKSAAERANEQLLEARGALAGANSEAESLRQALESARSELRRKEELLAAAAQPVPPSLADTGGTATAAAAPAASGSGVVPAATWTVIEEAEAGTSQAEELEAALARIDDLAARLSASEQRTADLERYLGDQAPPPPPLAPR